MAYSVGVKSIIWTPPCNVRTGQGRWSKSCNLLDDSTKLFAFTKNQDQDPRVIAKSRPKMQN